MGRPVDHVGFFKVATHTGRATRAPSEGRSSNRGCLVVLLETPCMGMGLICWPNLSLKIGDWTNNYLAFIYIFRQRHMDHNTRLRILLDPCALLRAVSFITSVKVNRYDRCD